MASINEVVRVTLKQNPQGASRKNFGVIALFTPESGNVFNDSKTRYAYVNSLADVVSMFGTNSETVKCAELHFMQEPRAEQLIICRWNKTGKEFEPTKTALKGATINNSLIEFKQVKKGSFSLTIGSQIVVAKDIDLTSAVTFENVAEVITKAVKSSGLTAKYDKVAHRIILEASSTGKTGEIGYAFVGEGDGEYLGDLLKLEDGQATKIQGQDTVAIKPESAEQALYEVAEVNNEWVGYTFAEQLTDDEILQASDYALANGKIFALSVIKDSQLENNSSNVIKKIKDKTNNNVLALFDKNDMYQAMSLLSIMLSVNYSAQNSVITAKFKQLPGVTADDITATERRKAKALGINTYTYFNDVAMLSEGTMVGGRWADEVIGLMWIKDAIQIEVFNTFLKNANIPYTDEGNAILESAVKKVCYEALNNGFIAPGEWTKRGFGTLKMGDWLKDGFYTWFAPMRTASGNDRNHRKPTPIQVALKLGGAIHFSDIIVDFDR